MRKREVIEKNKELQEMNKLYINKLARIARHVEGYSLCGKQDIPLKEIEEILRSKELL